MSLTVYVGHSVVESENAFLWEFQANAAAHGIKVVLAKYQPVSSLTASRRADIANADAFLAVVTRPSQAVEAEAAHAKAIGKPVFVYTWHGVPFAAPPASVVISLSKATRAAELLADVATKLAPFQKSKNDEAGKALAAVIGVGAALFLLALLGKGK